ncbi:Phosphatidylglycerophosphatase B [Streptococcus sp. DD10]|nr:Phosphatidylglycerophosphatase B [Streptococcus sp. DD10]
MGLSYLVVLLLRGLGGDSFLLLRDIVVPASGFIVLSVVRFWMNQERPYEREFIHPLFSKETKGQSFPSRHVFSATIISMVVFWYSMELGIFCLFFSALLGLVRVVGGVHYPRDVVAGYVFALFWGILFNFF